MNLTFDLQHIDAVEFGVGRETGSGWRYDCVPVDKAVQRVLHSMLCATWNTWSAIGNPVLYETGNILKGEHQLYLPANNEYAQVLLLLHEANNFEISSAALNDVGVFAYFTRFRDVEGRRLTALRRSSWFTGLLKKPLLHFLSDTLNIVEEKVFKLDSTFDILIDNDTVFILRPVAFEFFTNLRSKVVEAVPENIAELQTQMPFVNFDSIRAFAARYVRAARYLAGIRAGNYAHGVDRHALVEQCRRQGIALIESDGVLMVALGHEMNFLQLLDRRLHAIELVPNKRELYRADNRQRRS